MNSHKKSGVLTIVCGAVTPFLPLLFTLYPWVESRGLLSNLLTADIVIGGDYLNEPTVSIPIRWLFFFGIALVAYGLLMFLGVLKAPKWLAERLPDDEDEPIAGKAGADESKVSG